MKKLTIRTSAIALMMYGLAATAAQSAPPTPSSWDVQQTYTPGAAWSMAQPWQTLQASGSTCATAGATLSTPYTGGGGAWIGRGSPGSLNLPLAFKAAFASTTAVQGMTIAAGQVGMHPSATDCSVIRFKAPADGIYKVSGEFFAPVDSQTKHPNKVTGRILDKGIQVASGVVDLPNGVNHWSFPNSLTFSLQAGQTLDLAVDNGGNGFSSDTVLLAARVTWIDDLPATANTFKATDFDFEGYHGCAVEQGTTKLFCWGQGVTSGLMLGNNNSVWQNMNKAVPATAVDTFLSSNNLGNVQTVQVGATNNCVVTYQQKTVCFGENGKGESGAPPSGNSAITNVTPALGGARFARLDNSTVCAITTSQQVRCWGSNTPSGAPGKLGFLNGGADSHVLLAAVPNVTGATDVGPGGSMSCAVVEAAHKVICWGKNLSGWETAGLMGNGSGGPVLTHPDNPGGFYQAYVKMGNGDLTGVSRVEVKGSRACALRNTGILVCWGMNATWGMASGAPSPPAPNILDTATPISMPGGVTDFALSERATCVVSGPVARVYCQGENDSGQVGQLPPSTTEYWSFNPTYPGTYGNLVVKSNLTNGMPNAMPLTNVTKIRGGREGFCALRSTGVIMCWGRGNSGELGNGATTFPTFSATPVQVTK